MKASLFKKPSRTTLRVMALAASGLVAAAVMAHGDVVPQSVDTTTLPQLGAKWLDANPYNEQSPARKEALRIGTSAYNQNCARCHGLEAISGGISPDLRLLTPDAEGDEWFKERVINGAVRDGAVYMPKMADYISQEGLWAIRAYLESVHVEE